MKDLYDITVEINKRYIDGEDWVYAKGKKAEIELIKDMFQLCQNQDKEISELRQEVRVLDPWEAYYYAEARLSDIKLALEMWAMGFRELEEAKEKYEEAHKAMNDSLEYMKSIRSNLLEKSGKNT